MELTTENKKYIDNLSYESLLSRWRFTPTTGNQWFQGETGIYWAKRMKELRDKGVDHVNISKKIGW